MSKGRKRIDAATVEEEADLLKQLWDAADQSKRGTQAEFGEKHDIGSQGLIWQLLNAKTPINLKAAKSFAAGLGCKISDFSPRLAELATAWPFELVDRELYEALSPAMQHKAQVRLEDVIKELLQEQQVKEAAPNKVPGIAGRVLEQKLTTESKAFHPEPQKT